MITQPNLATPPHSLIQRVSLLKLAPPLAPQVRYCCIFWARKDARLDCAIIRLNPALSCAPDFAAVLRTLHAGLWPKRQLADTLWVDIACTILKGARPQLLVRTTTMENATTELVWQARDLEFVAARERRLRFSIDVLRRLDAGPGKPWSRLGSVLRATALRYWRLGRGPQ